jgi:thiamine biosynthesis lipoprotein
MLPLLLALAMLASGCEQGPRVETFAGSTMGTTYHVTVVGQGNPSHGRKEMQESIDSVLREVNAHLSTYQAPGEISVFNRSTSLEWQPSPDHVCSARCRRSISRETGGAFDITAPRSRPLGPVPTVERWKSHGICTFATRTTRARLVGPGSSNSVPRTLGARCEAVRLDVNGIAPCYAVDRIAGISKTLGSSTASSRRWRSAHRWSSS